ncbi:MAG: SRPBCC domain-containing protein [Fimbriimonadaceae bacterium]
MNLQTVIIEREFAHPLEVIFRAFVDPEINTKWIAPDGYDCLVNIFEPKVGGKQKTVFRDQSGTDATTEGTVLEFVENEMVYYEFSIEFGEFKMEGLSNRLIFERTASGTKVTVDTKVPEGDFAEGCVAGWNQSFDNLEKIL